MARDIVKSDAEEEPAARSRIVHDGEFGEIFVLFLVNVALGLVTLGIFRFWAKTRIRRYVWSHTSFLGDRFEYSGTGKELFLGFLLALLFLLPAIAVLVGVQIGYPDDQELLVGLQVVFYIILFLLYGVAVYSAYRYRLSRTHWRGIRAAATGSRWGYGWRFFLFTLLSWFTMGFFTPYGHAKLWAYRINTTSLGDRPMRFDGEGGALLPNYFVAWLLYIPTLSLSMVWYKAAELRYFVSHTSYEDLTFETEIKGGELLGFYLLNLLLLIVTLGFAWPYVILRTARLIAQHVSIIGEQDFAAIAQSQAERPRTGEGLAEFLDVGGI